MFIFDEIPVKYAYIYCSWMCLLGLLSVASLHAQLPVNTAYSLGINYGRVIKNNPIFPEIQHNSPAVTIDFQQKLSGKRPWHHALGVPTWGVSLGGWNLGNAQVLGYGLGIAPTLTFILAENQRNVVTFTAGLGLGYLTKRFDVAQNPNNNIIGSHLNAYGILSGAYTYKLRQNLHLMAGLNVIHYSNGNTSAPNLGVNVPALFCGLKVKGVTTPPQTAIAHPVATYKRKLYSSVRVGAGISENGKGGGPTYAMYTLSYSLNYTLNGIARLKVGTEWLHSRRSYALLVEGERMDSLAWNASGGILFVGGELLLGHVGVLAQVGPYFHKAYNMNKWLYTKVGFQFYPFSQSYRPRKQIFAGVYIHAHSGEADFAEIGMGYVF